jgi:hypothetical protein
MRRRTRAARAIVLMEILAVVSLGTVLSGMVFVTLKQIVDLHRAAAAHLDRQATVTALTRQLRKDAGAASAWRWNDMTLVLTTAGRPGGTVVEYRIAPEQVTRTAEGTETHAWRACGLTFSANVESGTYAGMLTLEIGRASQAGAARAVTRRAILSLLLPGLQGASR